MRTSDKGREFIKREEGVRLDAYRDSAGFLTIGVGHLIKEDDDIGLQITESEMEQLFTEDLAISEEDVSRAIEVPLEQHQFDAMVSWTFNLGGYNLRRSTLRKKLNAGEYDEVPAQMMRWVYAGDQNGDGKIDFNDRVRGLVRRREREARLFAEGDYGF